MLWRGVQSGDFTSSAKGAWNLGNLESDNPPSWPHFLCCKIRADSYPQYCVIYCLKPQDQFYGKAGVTMSTWQQDSLDSPWTSLIGRSWPDTKLGWSTLRALLGCLLGSGAASQGTICVLNQCPIFDVMFPGTRRWKLDYPSHHHSQWLHQRGNLK